MKSFRALACHTRTEAQRCMMLRMSAKLSFCNMDIFRVMQSFLNG